MRLRIKILSGFLIMAMMLLIAGVWSIYELRSIGISVQKLLDDNYTSIRAAKEMKDALEREDSAILLLLLGNWQNGRHMLVSADSLFNQGLLNAYQCASIPGETAHLDSIDSRYQLYKKLWERPIVDTAKQGDLEWYFQKVHQSFLAVNISVDELISLNEKLIYKSASQMQDKSNRAIMPGIVAIIVALLFSFMFSFFVNYYVVSPIVRITKGVKHYLHQDLPFDVEVDTTDELFDLAASIKTLCAFANSIKKKNEH